MRHADPAAAARDVERYAAGVAALGDGFVESFMTAPSPGIVASAMQNAHYPGLPEYVAALAEALRPEYEAVVEGGLVLQVDCPDLAMERHTLFADKPLDEFLAFVDVVIAGLNRALDRCAPDRVRLHVCWGNYEGPHDLDVPLEVLLPTSTGRASGRWCSLWRTRATPTSIAASRASRFPPAGYWSPA